MSKDKESEVKTSESEQLSADDSQFLRQLVTEMVGEESHAFASRGVPASCEKIYRWGLQILEFDKKVRAGYKPGIPQTGRRTTQVEYPDPDTGEMKTRTEFVDEDAHCPNLPKSHPFNQKSAYYLDGHDKEDAARIAESQLPAGVN